MCYVQTASVIFVTDESFRTFEFGNLILESTLEDQPFLFFLLQFFFFLNYYWKKSQRFKSFSFFEDEETESRWRLNHLLGVTWQGSAGSRELSVFVMRTSSIVLDVATRELRVTFSDTV